MSAVTQTRASYPCKRPGEGSAILWGPGVGAGHCRSAGSAPWTNGRSETVLVVNLSQDLLHTLDELGQDFLLRFYETEIERHPANLEVLAELGQLYTSRGEWTRGLEVDQRLVGLIPENPTAHYNLACSQALLGQAEASLESLELAVACGYDDAGFMAEDDDLASVREEPRFLALLERLRSDASGV